MSATTTLIKRTFVETSTEGQQLVKEEFLWEEQGADVACEFAEHADGQYIHYTGLNTLQERAEALDDKDLMEVVKAERANEGTKGTSYLISIDY